MKTNVKIKSIFGVVILVTSFFLLPSCNTDKDEPSDPKPKEETSILEQRNAFWKEWIDKCFPGEDWNTTTFVTNGVEYTAFKANDPDTWQAMVDMYIDTASANSYLPGVVNSGSTNPIEVYAYAGQKLYKIVPAGKDISGPSPYYVTETQLEWIKLHPAELEQKLGLPLSSVSGEYWIYSITSVADSNLFFQSTIAPTDQFANATPNIVYSTPGGATQSLLINNGDPMKWKKSDEPVEKYIPDTLPKIEE